jgi:hypothetical protein
VTAPAEQRAALDDLVQLLAEWIVRDYETEQREERTDEREAKVAVAG